MTPARARLTILAAALLWSLSGAFSKRIGLPGPTMACYRVLFAGLCFLPFIRWENARFRPAMVGMVTSFTLMNVSFISAMTITTAANVIFLQYTAPLWMFLGSHFWLKEPWDGKNAVTLVVGMIGIGVILAGGWRDDALGIVLSLFAGVTYALVVLFLRLLRDEDALWLTFLNHFASGCLLVPVLYLWLGPESLTAVSPRQMVALAVFGVVQMGLPYLLFSRAIRAVTPQEAGILTLLEPVVNPLLAWLAVGERPSEATMLGGAIILSGVLWRYLPARSAGVAVKRGVSR